MKFIKALPLAIGLTVLAGLSFSATSLAANASAPSSEPALFDLLQPVYNAFAGGHYAYCGALTVVLMVALAKRYAGEGKVGNFVRSDMGGSLTALLMAGAGALATGLAAPAAHLSLALFESAALVGIGAAGGYAVLKNVVVDPLLKPLAAKAPKALQPLFNAVLWIFDHTTMDAPTPPPAVTPPQAKDTDHA